MKINKKIICLITMLICVLITLTVVFFYKVTDSIILYSIIVIAIIIYLIFLTAGIYKNKNDYIKAYKSFIEVMIVVNSIMSGMFLIDLKFFEVSIVSVLMLLLEIITLKLVNKNLKNK